MKITFEETELANLIGKVEEWHQKRFDYVVLNVCQNYDPVHSFRSSGIADSGHVHHLIEKFEQVFAKDNPYPKWKDLL